MLHLFLDYSPSFSVQSTSQGAGTPCELLCSVSRAWHREEQSHERAMDTGICSSLVGDILGWGDVSLVCGRDKTRQPQNTVPSGEAHSRGEGGFCMKDGVHNRERQKSDDGQGQVQKGVCVWGGGTRFLPLLFISKKTPQEEGAPGQIYSPANTYSLF